LKKIIGIISVILVMSVIGCSSEPPQKNVHTVSIFENSLMVKKIKETQHQWNDVVGGATVPISIVLSISFEKPGYYRFETWQRRYRNTDVLGESIETSVSEAPKQLNFILQKDFYRLEVIRVYENTLDKESILFGQIFGWSNVLPKDNNY